MGTGTSSVCSSEAYYMLTILLPVDIHPPAKGVLEPNVQTTATLVAQTK